MISTENIGFIGRTLPLPDKVTLNQLSSFCICPEFLEQDHGIDMNVQNLMNVHPYIPQYHGTGELEANQWFNSDSNLEMSGNLDFISPLAWNGVGSMAIDTKGICCWNIPPTSYLNEHQRDLSSVYTPYSEGVSKSARQSNLSKSKVNVQLLKNYQWEVEKRKNENGGITTVYICKYEGCDKEFTRTWSILDHVRMHEGVRPYVCKYCSRTYTQKGNMIKHMRRHTQPNVDSRRAYICEFCNHGYTEKYNLKVLHTVSI